MPIPNELAPELLSTGAFSIAPGMNSGNRLQMMGGAHLPQMLQIRGATPRRCFTGVEREYGKYTFKIKMPCDGIIHGLVPRYPETIGRSAISANPLTAVLYENVDTQELGLLELPQHSIRHQYFGFRYSYKPAARRLTKGASIAKDTIFADTPAIDENNDYNFGLECNVAFMSLPGVIEDGFIISESLSKRLNTQGFETVDASWGKRYYPLNLYGNDEVYKPFPDIGERVRPDGLIMVLREYDELIDPVMMTPAALRTVDPMFDKPVYTKGGSKVIDVLVRHDPKGNTPETPPGMEEQARKYYNAQVQYYNNIQAIVDQRQKLYGKVQQKITPQLHRLLRESLDFKFDQAKVKATRIVNRVALEEWRVDLTVEYELEPTYAFKITGLNGDKGVICAVWPDEHMPVDKHGTRAEVITAPEGVPNRMVIARLLEHTINATSDQVLRNIKARLEGGWTPEAIDWCWKHVCRYYEIVSPSMYRALTSSSYQGTPESHLRGIIKSPLDMRIHLPTNNRVSYVDVCNKLAVEYPIDIGPVTYTGQFGDKRTTKSDIVIASLYMILLEKTGGDWSAVSSGTLQQHGILTKLSRADRHAHPGRRGPTRTLGEDEGRHESGFMADNLSAQKLIPKYGPTAADGLAVAEFMDASNNPVVHQHIIENILKADRPTDIQTVVDRVKHPLGGNRALSFVKHHLEIAGIDMPYQDDLRQPPTVYRDNEGSVDAEPMFEIEDGDE